MNNFNKKLTPIVMVGAVSILFCMPLALWWANRIPGRPRTVDPKSTFLWAPHVGLPAARRGQWISCWSEGRVTRCRLSSKDGVTEFEGEFMLAEEDGRFKVADLTIDARRTERAPKFFIGDALVPLVYLESGAILVPVARLKEGREAVQPRKLP